MKIERELMRGAGPVAVLKLLQSGPKYGYELVTAIAQRSDGILAIGQSTLYPMLYNLESQGFVRAEWQQAESGRRRKYYCLTAKGEARLASDTEQWRALERAMRGLGILPDGSAGSVAAGGASA